MAPPIALLMVGVLLLEPPALTPRERVPTLRLFTGPGATVAPRSDIVLEPDPVSEPEATELDTARPPEQEVSDGEDDPSSSVVIPQV